MSHFDCTNCTQRSVVNIETFWGCLPKMMYCAVKLCPLLIPCTQIFTKNLQSSSGSRCEAMLLKEAVGNNEKGFRSDCLMFLSQLASEIRKRFPLHKDGVIAMMQNMDPNEATNTHRQLKSIIKLAMQFPSLVSEDEFDDLQDEWRALPYAKEILSPMMTRSLPEFWYKLGGYKEREWTGKVWDTFKINMWTYCIASFISFCGEDIFTIKFSPNQTVKQAENHDSRKQTSS